MEKASVSQKQATEEELREALDGDMTSSEDGEAEDGDSNYEPGLMNVGDRLGWRKLLFIGEFF